MLGGRKRGRPGLGKKDDRDVELEALQRVNDDLTEKLRQAELIIEVQKKFRDDQSQAERQNRLDAAETLGPQVGIQKACETLSPGLYRAQTGSTTGIVASDRVFGLELINENRRQEIARNTSDLGAQELLAFGPGSRVSLAVELHHLGKDSETVAGALRERLEKLGFVVDEKAPLRLEAVVLRGEELQEVVRDHFGSRFGPVHERIRYTPHTSYLKLKLNEDVLWQISANHSASGPFLQMARNETPQDAATRLCKPNPAYFTNAAIPSKISRLPKDRPPGKSHITAAGLQ